MTKKGTIGSGFGDWMKTEGIEGEATARAIKEVLAWQIMEAMKEQHMTKTEMARRMNTSRSQLDRLLDPANDTVKLQTLHKAASAVGRELRLELV